MSDEIDLAQEREEQDRARAIAAARKAAEVGVTGADGICLNCGEDVSRGQRFCDSDCRDDWEARVRATRRGGRGLVGDE